MLCKECKTEFQGKFCPTCGKKSENKLFDKLKKYMYDDSEDIISVLGNNIAETFVSKGIFGNGFAILSNKRVYFKGNCLIRKGKGFYRMVEEKSVDVKDITGTGFVHNQNLITKILFYTVAAVWGLANQFSWPFWIVYFTTHKKWAFYVALGVSSLGLGLLLYYLYKIFNYSLFEISYAGGGIGFDMHWIEESESREFQKDLNLLKDKIKADDRATVIRGQEIEVEQKNGSIPEQLKQFKDLLDSGIITQDEFDAKKKQILAL